MTETPKLEDRALASLRALVDDVTKITSVHLENMDPETLSYIMNHYRKYLKLDLERDFNEVYKESQNKMLDDLFRDG